MKTKVTYTQAGDFVREAYRLAGVCNKDADLRFGQALWNLLPLRVTRPHTDTAKDFFYEEDTLVVYNTFYDHFVE